MVDMDPGHVAAPVEVLLAEDTSVAVDVADPDDLEGAAAWAGVDGLDRVEVIVVVPPPAATCSRPRLRTISIAEPPTT